MSPIDWSKYCSSWYPPRARIPRITMRLIGLSFLKPAWCISNEPLENMPSGVEQSKQISGNSLSSSSVICGSMVQVLSTSPWLSRTMDPLEQQASSASPVKPCSPIGNVERPVAGTTCRPASVSSRMARRMVPSASCRAFSSVPSKSLANILIMGVPLLRLHDIVDEGGARPNNDIPARRDNASAHSRCPSALRQSSQATFQPIKQHRRHRQHRQHACEYNRRSPLIVCEPVNQLANRRCTGKHHINECQHFPAEFLWR